MVVEKEPVRVESLIAEKEEFLSTEIKAETAVQR